MGSPSRIPMRTIRRMRTKLVLVGESGVGKTSLVRRFVLNEYEDAYVPTVGTKVTRIELTVPHGAEMDVQMDMAIFDITGQKGFRDLVRETYYHGAQGLLAVCDFTKKESLSALTDWIPTALEITGDVPAYLVANKKDLEAQRAFSDDEIREVAESFAAPLIFASARTGEFVEDAFNVLAIEMVDRAFRQEEVRAADRGLGHRLLLLLEKRGSIGLKRHQLFEILRGVSHDDLQKELEGLEGEGLVTILWYGASDFSVTITPRGTRAVKQAAAEDEE
jgi:small GTP-binding protein